MMTPNALLLTALLGFLGAEKEIVLGSGMRGSGSRGSVSRGSTRNRHGFSALRAIVTGMEHSGTTAFSSILFNTPCVIGAWETGFLLAKTPGDIREVHPWCEWHMNMNRKEMYMLKPSDVDALVKARDFPEMLDALRNRSHIFNNLIDEPYCDKPYQMIDKTPLYVYKPFFERILQETHSANVPVIVLKKNYYWLKASWIKRKGVMLKNLYDQTYQNVERMIRKYPNRIMVVNWNDMLLNVEPVMQEVFHFIGLEWRTDYLKMTNLKKKFTNYGLNDSIESYSWKSKFRNGKYYHYLIH